ncbi:MAG: hypothetical protein OSA93_17130 [Akkermansiaceae bacterium]|nr:hypothetical protein [Akkermansiaceae bacterium]
MEDLAATNALSCANMALGGYAHIIPLAEVIFHFQTPRRRSRQPCLWRL